MPTAPRARRGACWFRDAQRHRAAIEHDRGDKRRHRAGRPSTGHPRPGEHSLEREGKGPRDEVSARHIAERIDESHDQESRGHGAGDYDRPLRAMTAAHLRPAATDVNANAPSASASSRRPG